MPLVHGRLVGKYRGLLIDHADLFREAELLAPRLQLLAERHTSGTLTDATFTRDFILLFAHHRAAKYDARQIRGMPGMIFSILTDWAAGRANLRLTAQPVSAIHMLRAQAEGWRYVTVDLEAALCGRVIEGDRDAFEFALHDLGHAYAFFKPDYDPPGQVEFFQQLARDLPLLEPYAAAEAQFADALEYCMADMNSHPQHLRQYLRGVIVEMFLRRSGSAVPDEGELSALLNNLHSLAAIQKISCLPVG